MNFQSLKYNFATFVCLLLFSCNNQNNTSTALQAKKDSATSCMMVPARFSGTTADSSLQFNGDTSVKGMVFIKGGTFMMGGDNSQASADEFPKHKVEVSSFWMDAAEVNWIYGGNIDKNKTNIG